MNGGALGVESVAVMSTNDCAAAAATATKAASSEKLKETMKKQAIEKNVVDAEEILSRTGGGEALLSEIASPRPLDTIGTYRGDVSEKEEDDGDDEGVLDEIIFLDDDDNKERENKFADHEDANIIKEQKEQEKLIEKQINEMAQMTKLKA